MRSHRPGTPCHNGFAFFFSIHLPALYPSLTRCGETEIDGLKCAVTLTSFALGATSLEESAAAEWLAGTSSTGHIIELFIQVALKSDAWSGESHHPAQVCLTRKAVGMCILRAVFAKLGPLGRSSSHFQLCLKNGEQHEAPVIAQMRTWRAGLGEKELYTTFR